VLKKPLVVIIVTNYNGASITFKGKPILQLCLKSIIKSSYKKIKIIVADDKSFDKSKQLANNFRTVEFIVNKKKRGFATNNNNAIKYAIKKYNPDYILLLNNDIIIKDRYWLNKLLKIAEKDNKIGIVSPKTIYPDGTLQYNGIYLKYGVMPRIRVWESQKRNKESEEIEIAGGAAMLIKRSVINKIGLLDENFIMGLEDVDYSLRARQAGFNIIYYSKTNIVHLEHYTTNYFPKKDTVKFKEEQFNYAYFSIKHFHNFKRFKSLLLNVILRSFFETGPNSGIKNIKLRHNILFNLDISIKEILNAYKIYRNLKPR